MEIYIGFGWFGGVKIILKLVFLGSSSRIFEDPQPVKPVRPVPSS